MSTKQNNNHSNNGTRNAGVALGAVSVIVTLFYVLEFSSGYELPDWLTFIILLVVVIVPAVLAAIIAIFKRSSPAKNIANFLGRKEFHMDIKLFIFPLILIVFISMVAFKCVNSNCENTANVIVATCKSNAIKDAKDSGNKAEINKKKQICMNRFITFVMIAAIFYIAQLRKTAMKNEYDETKIDLDYMQKRNRYVNCNSNVPNFVVGGRKGFTEKKETLKYYSSMKNNYESITFFFAFASLIMGFSKLG